MSIILEEYYPKSYNILPCKITILKDGKKDIQFPHKWKEYENKCYPRDLLNGSLEDRFVICGKISNLIVLDFDIKKGENIDYEELYDEIVKFYPPFKRALTIRTQSGGLHFHIEPESMKCYEDLERNKDLECKLDLIDHFDIQGERKIAFIYPSKKYKIINQKPPLKLSNEEFSDLVRRFKRKSVKKQKTEVKKKISSGTNIEKKILLMAKEFQDILKGKIEIESYAKEHGKKEFIYWKFLFREANKKSELEPEDLKKKLEENQPAFDWDTTLQQLIHHPITEKPMTNKMRKEYFPDYYVKKTKADLYDAYEITELILGMHDIKTLGVSKPDYCIYKNGVYKRNQLRTIKTINSTTLKDLGIDFSLRKSYELLELIANETSIVSIEEFDKNRSILNLSNGLFNIDTLKLTEHTPEYLSLKQIPITFDAKAKCPKIAKFLHSIFNARDIRYLLQKIGLSLTSNMKFQDGTFLFGAGNNGKTTFYSLLRLFLGTSNCCGVDLHRLNSFEFATIENKFANIVSDVDASQKINIKNYKLYVGNELVISINRKFKEPYDIPPTAQMWYSCNSYFPQVPVDTDKGFWRKVNIIECPNDFDNREDPDILEKISTPEELSGLLNLVIMHLRYLLKRNKFSKRYNDWQRVKNYWLDRNNIFPIFLIDKAITGDNYYSNKQETWKRFNSWLNGNGKPPISDKKVTKMIKSLPEIYHVRKTINGVQKWIYTGFTFPDLKLEFRQKYNQKRLI